LLPFFSLSLRERAGVRALPLGSVRVEALPGPHPALSRRERVKEKRPLPEGEGSIERVQ
jgi:hypothetical protein